MYLDHFNLRTTPFALSTDPRFLWAGANQRQALATLSYGLQENRGIVVLSGEFGTGKTTLVNAFVQGLDDTVRVAKLPEPGTDTAHFRMAVAEGFGLQTTAADLAELIESLSQLADHQQDYCRRLLLVIDEAQGLTEEMQADVLRLACWEHRNHRLLHILLVGQTEVYQWACPATRNVLLHQVSATCRLHPLNASETAAYIDLRLRVAGTLRPLFDEAAVTAIHAASRGVPRAINLMCDFALLRAHMQGAAKVDAEMVDICKDRFQIALRDDGVTREVTVRDLATLPAKPSTPHRGKLRQRLGLATPLLLVFVMVGVWYYKAPNNPPVTGDKADAVSAPAAESSPPLPSPDPAASRPPSIPAAAAQKAATLPFAERRPDPHQAAPLKGSRLPTEGGVNPLPTAPPAADEAGGRSEALDPSAEKYKGTGTEALMKAQQPPTETAAVPRPAAQPALEAEETPKAADDERPGVPTQEPPPVAAEQKPGNLALGRPAGNSDTQGFVAPMAPASDSPTDADPGDIIDWLIQKKRTGGRVQQPVPAEAQPASE